MNAANSWLPTVAGRGMSELVLLSWQAMILVSSVWLGLKLTRVKSPALRHQVWLLTVVAVVLLPLAGAFARRFPTIQAGRPTLSYLIEAPRMVISQSDSKARDPSPSLVVGDSAGSSSPLTASLLITLLFIAWLIAMLALATRLAGEQRLLQARCKRAKFSTPEELEIFEFAALAQHKIQLKLSAEIDSPLLCGIIRPVILLPENLAEWTTPDERKAIIEHEIAHVARRDPFANLFQTMVRVIFFFHPLIRYACRQLSIERELACDTRVMEMGTRGEVYAESLLKVAERSLLPKLRHQLAFLSAKQILERRVEMIVNDDGVRIAARHWKGVTLSASLIAASAWLLIPANVNSGLAQTANARTENLEAVRVLGERKAFDELIEMALRNPDFGLRRLAAICLTSLEGDGSTRAMTDLYNQTNDPDAKIMVIDALARISEIEPLTKIALSDQNSEYRQRALRRIKFLKTNSESADIRNWDVTGLAEQLNQVKEQAPPPPPPQPVQWRRKPPPPPARR
jgi:beta-lactamase regulating signal transducer with metallopeptidase domain